MGANSFGNLFRITTWGESHGKAIGVVIDGCPAGLPLSEDDINAELAWRQGGKSPYTTPRKEKDFAEIYSGVFEGKTTGTPLSIIIFNTDARPASYEPIKKFLRPGHATFSYLEKYGVFDYRGGGRASARETVARVAAGAVAKKILGLMGIEVVAYVCEIGGVSAHLPESLPFKEIQSQMAQSPVYCPDKEGGLKMAEKIRKAQEEGDSVGGIVAVLTSLLPTGLGDPIYEKLEANLGAAMLSIPAAKGFEMGSGFEGARMRGAAHNDLFILKGEREVTFNTNHSGGTLGGISTGMPLQFRVAFKPPSSIQRPQATLTTTHEPATFSLPEGSRHDPCVAIRAVPVVKSMTELVLVDAILMNKCCKLS